METLWGQGFWVWLVALSLYAVFLGWYRNWRGKLTPTEVERYISEAVKTQDNDLNDFGVIRKFLEEDDGCEFVMVNLVKVASGEVPDPETGQPVRGAALLRRYTKPFMRALFARGGHPALVTRKVGGYVDAWNVAPDPGWTIAGCMRYRSRRDLMELVIDPRFRGMHAFKIAATPETFSFPSQPLIRIYLSPFTWVPMLLALCAALAQLVVLLA